ncbi:MAG: hypothetical protein KF787_13230 [Phycisphaeraceae bacterium]|nr:hypothetical protein [Phycisphaeraceae bacterium]
MRDHNDKPAITLSILVMAAAGVYAGCFVGGGTATCCGTYFQQCSTNGTPPLHWYCPQTASNGSAVQVALIQDAMPGQLGVTTTNTSVVGSCTITPRTCGAAPGSCVVGTDYVQECTSTTLSGNVCEGEVEDEG